MGATRIGKSTLLNALVSRSAGRHLAPFTVGASETAVTQGIDVFSAPESGIAFLDVEGIGAHGASYDARLLALPIVVSDVVVYCTQLKPAAVSKIREQLHHHVVTAHSLLRGVRPSAHLCLVFRDSDFEASEAAALSDRVGAEIFGRAWAPDALLSAETEQASADRIVAAFPSISVTFLPPLHRARDAEFAGVALDALWSKAQNALHDCKRAPAFSADRIAGFTAELARRLSSRVESASIEVSSVYDAVLQGEARSVLTQALAPLSNLSAAEWRRFAAQHYGSVSSLMQTACLASFPPPPIAWAPDAQKLVGSFLRPLSVPAVRTWFEAQVSSITSRASAAIQAEQATRERAATEAAAAQQRRLLAAQQERLQEERRAAAVAAAARREAEEARATAEREAENRRREAAAAERQLEEQRQRDQQRRREEYRRDEQQRELQLMAMHGMHGQIVMTPMGPMIMTPYGLLRLG